MNQFNKRVRTNTGNIFNINYESTVENNNTGGGGGGGASVVVVNNLVTDDPDAALSAAQGVVLKTITDNLDSTLDEIVSAVDTIDIELNSMDGRVTANTNNIATNTSQISALNTSVDQIDDLVQQLNTNVGNLTADVGSLNSQVATNTSNITTLSNDVVDVQTSIMSLDNTTSSNTSRISSLESFVNQNVKTTAAPTFAGATIAGNIAVSGTVDGRDVSVDGTNLDVLLSRVNQSVTTSAAPQFLRVRLGNSSDVDTTRFISALDSTMTSGSDRFFTIGRTNSAGNQGEIGFRWIGDGNAGNELYLGFHSGKILSLYYDGRVRPSGAIVLPTNNSVALGVTGSMNWNGTTGLPRFHNGTGWNDVATKSSVDQLNAYLNTTDTDLNSLSSEFAKKKIYGVYSFRIRRDGAGVVWFDSFTQTGYPLSTIPAPGSSMDPSQPIYFQQAGAFFDWGSNMGIIPSFNYIGNVNNFTSVPGIGYVQENNQTFSIKPYLGGSLSDWGSTLSNDTGIGYTFVLQRFEF